MTIATAQASGPGEGDTRPDSRPFLFISYSHRDGDFVHRLVADLTAQGVPCWIDQAGLKPGTPDWEQSVRQAIRTSAAVLLVASPDSRLTTYVGGEIEVAKAYGRKIYAVWANGEDWVDCIRMDLVYSQYIDARDARYDTAVARLVDQMHDQLAEIPAEAGPITQLEVNVRNPYKGLSAFRCGDAGDFFGRDNDVRCVLETLRSVLQPNADGSARLVAVVGASGSGKSSLVMAGLLPALMTGQVDGSANWAFLGERDSTSSGLRLVDPIVPGDHPVEALTLALSAKLPNRSVKSVREDLDDDSCRGLHRITTMLCTTPGQRFVVFVDQFEELFTQTVDEQERRQFIDTLVGAVTDTRGPTVAVITLRADFYHQLMNYPELWQVVQPPHTFHLTRMAVEDLREIVAKPAWLPDTNLTFEGDLIGDMLLEVRDQEAALPLLEFTLDQLFQHRQGQRLTIDAYRHIGGVTGALGKHADEVYAGLPFDKHRELARELFSRLINVSSGEERPTRRRFVGELILATPTETAAMREVVQTFVRQRLLTAGTYANQQTLELSHEALVLSWERLRMWSREDTEGRRIRDELITRAEQWDHHQRDVSALYDGALLREARDWSSTRKPILSQLESEFLAASEAQEALLLQRELESRAATRRLTRAWLLPVGLALATGVVCLVLSVALSADSLPLLVGISVLVAVGALAYGLINTMLALGVVGLLEWHSWGRRRARVGAVIVAALSAIAGALLASMTGGMLLSGRPILPITDQGRAILPPLVGIVCGLTLGAGILWALGAMKIPMVNRLARLPRWPVRTALLAIAPVVLASLVGFAHTQSPPGQYFSDDLTHAGKYYNHQADGTRIVYDQSPPNHGEHYAAPHPWGVSESPVAAGNFVHNLEHGGIVVLYSCPTGCPAMVDQLVRLPDLLPREQHFGRVKALVSPYDKLEYPITLLAWDFQQDLNAFDFNTIKAFYDAHVDKGPELVP